MPNTDISQDRVLRYPHSGNPVGPLGLAVLHPLMAGMLLAIIARDEDGRALLASIVARADKLAGIVARADCPPCELDVVEHTERMAVAAASCLAGFPGAVTHIRQYVELCGPSSSS